MRDVLPANVEQPRNRIERRDHHRIMAFLRQPIGHQSALFRRGLPGARVIMHQRRRR